MKRSSLWFWFLLLAFFNAVDFGCTSIEVRRLGIEEEANPFMASLIATHGIGALALLKLFSLAALGALLLLVGARQLKVSLRRAVVVMAVTFGVLAVYHGLILYSTSYHL